MSEPNTGYGFADAVSEPIEEEKWRYNMRGDVVASTKLGDGEWVVVALRIFARADPPNHNEACEITLYKLDGTALNWNQIRTRTQEKRYRKENQFSLPYLDPIRSFTRQLCRTEAEIDASIPDDGLDQPPK